MTLNPLTISISSLTDKFTDTESGAMTPVKPLVHTVFSRTAIFLPAGLKTGTLDTLSTGATNSTILTSRRNKKLTSAVRLTNLNFKLKKNSERSNYAKNKNMPLLTLALSSIHALMPLKISSIFKTKRFTLTGSGSSTTVKIYPSSFPCETLTAVFSPCNGFLKTAKSSFTRAHPLKVYSGLSALTLLILMTKKPLSSSVRDSLLWPKSTSLHRNQPLPP